MNTLADAVRLFDDKPWAAHLYVTDQCNLDCHYCNEYDNSRPHPDTAALERYIAKIRELGVARLGFQGGEPLMHPDIARLVRFAKSLGFGRVSMSTNGFLLTKELLADLEDAGLDSIQLSVDRMTPIASTRKSLKSVFHKLAWFDNSPIKMNVAGVLFDESVDETAKVIDACLEQNVDVAARVIHDDLINSRKLRKDEANERLYAMMEHQEDLKRQGRRIHTSWNLIGYQKSMLRNEDVDWSCVAGYKYFFVSAEGKFWLCSQVRTDMNIMDVTPEILKGYNAPKPCQKGCGVYCTIDMSLAVSNPRSYLQREATGIARSRVARTARRAAERVGNVIGS